MKPFIITIISLLLVFGVGAFIMSGSAQATEKPNYSVVSEDGKIEIRQYPTMLLAEVTVDGDRRTANNRGFRKLAAFIFGDNVSQDKVAMTSPVVSKPKTEKIAMTSPVVSKPKSESIDMTSPVVRTEAPDGRWTVNFMMPSKYTMETLPKPTDPDIRIFESAPYRTVSIRYNGNNNTKNIAKHEAKLRAYIAENGLDVEGTPEYAGYDAPWVPGPMKRNEVHFRLAD